MKTRLYTRKRALISSVAMLLVAMIALGTATFAWFTKNTSSTANGIKVRTSQVSSLVISKLNKTWGTTVAYGEDKNLFPVSSADLQNWYSAEADNGLSYAKKTGDADDVTDEIFNTGKPVLNNDYVFAEQLNVKNAGTVAVTDVKIKFSLSGTSVESTAPASDGKYLRLAIVPVTDADTNNGTNATLPTPTVGNATFYGLEAESWYPLSSASAVSGTALTATSASSQQEFEVATTLAANEAKYYNIYVWFEGQDEDCFNYTGGADIPDITFSVTGTPASGT